MSTISTVKNAGLLGDLIRVSKQAVHQSKNVRQMVECAIRRRLSLCRPNEKNTSKAMIEAVLRSYAADTNVTLSKDNLWKQHHINKPFEAASHLASVLGVSYEDKMTLAGVWKLYVVGVCAALMKLVSKNKVTEWTFGIRKLTDKQIAVLKKGRGKLINPNPYGDFSWVDWLPDNC